MGMRTLLLVCGGFATIFAGMIVSSCQTTPPPLGIPLIDVHNHDASGSRYLASFQTWEKYGVSRVVLFGDISEPSAELTDQIALSAARRNPEKIIPFAAGINLTDPRCGDVIRERIREGARGVGEIVASSLYSPITSKLPWKAAGVADPRLTAVFGVCGQYRRPVLLHIDPLDLTQIRQLIAVAGSFPDTDIIVGHANAYSEIPHLKKLLEETRNVYLDFFPGFTVYNPDSRYRLADYVELIERFAERFFLSSDSGYGVGYDKAYQAIHETLGLVTSATAKRIASENFETLLEKAY